MPSKIAAQLEFFPEKKYPSKIKKNKNISDNKKTEGIQQQQIYSKWDTKAPKENDPGLIKEMQEK